MVGNGPLEPVMRRAASGMPNIVFVPFQNQSQMPRTYCAADLFVLPSHGGAETWGLSVNEAMCMARPIVVSSHVGCAQDLVHAGRNGLVFPAGNVDALTATLSDALSDRVRLASWGAESLRIVASYSYAAAAQGLCSALASVRPIAA
jgi:glycosyltransferase involved in cell wall biosynthesis